MSEDVDVQSSKPFAHHRALKVSSSSAAITFLHLLLDYETSGWCLSICVGMKLWRYGCKGEEVEIREWLFSAFVDCYWCECC
jgi:hypothetical protein